jgi:chromosomal replication initiator protein
VETRHAGSGTSHTATPSVGASAPGARQPGRNAERAVNDRGVDDRRPGRRAVGAEGSTPADILLAALEERIDPTEVDRYFGVGGVRVERRDDRRVRVLGSSGFLTRLVEKRFGAMLHEAAERSFGQGVEVEYAVDPAADSIKVTEPVEPAGRGAETGVAGRAGEADALLEPGATLEEFCVGPTNRLAYAAGVRLAEQPEAFGGPLFLHGPCGVGKTHLLQGIARRLLERGGTGGRPARVRYVNAEDFVSEFTTAIRKNVTDRFRARYRKLDLLCVDDVHLIAGKPATQQELVQTINATELASGRLALASDAHPRQLGHMSDALVSRFMAGMVVKVDLPDAALARQLVAKIATRRALPVQPAAVERIAEYAARAGSGSRTGSATHPVAAAGGATCCSVRELEGMVLKVEAVWRLLPELSGSPVGVLAVERALGEDRADALSSGPRRPPRGDEVVAAACRVMGVSASEFMGRGRHKRVVLARSIAAALCRKFTTMSYPEIARAMGRPNHSTIITACQRLGRQLEGGEPSGLDGELAGVSIARLMELADEETRRIAFGDRQGGGGALGNRGAMGS